MAGQATLFPGGGERVGRSSSASRRRPNSQRIIARRRLGFDGARLLAGLPFCPRDRNAMRLGSAANMVAGGQFSGQDGLPSSPFMKW